MASTLTAVPTNLFVAHASVGSLQASATVLPVPVSPPSPAASTFNPTLTSRSAGCESEQDVTPMLEQIAKSSNVERAKAGKARLDGIRQSLFSRRSRQESAAIDSGTAP
jgi:hypothetical protein